MLERRLQMLRALGGGRCAINANRPLRSAIHTQPLRAPLCGAHVAHAAADIVRSHCGSLRGYTSPLRRGRRLLAQDPYHAFIDDRFLVLYAGLIRDTAWDVAYSP